MSSWPGFKKFPARVAEIRDRLPTGTAKEIWWQDEVQFGEKNKITRRWAKRETRNAALGAQGSAHTIGLYLRRICPARGVGAALVLPKCNTQAMTLHLKEISAAGAPGAHAIVIIDQAGRHFSNTLGIPDNITLIPLPPKSRELHPVENFWQFIRSNRLSNRRFKSYNDIHDHCCVAWNQLIDQPWRIMSIGMRDWAHQWFFLQAGIISP